MINYADIYLWGEHVATVAWDEQRQAGSFEYAPDFVKKEIQLSPLMMPVEKGRLYQFPSLSEETFARLPGLLADALPDAFGKALLDRWLATAGRGFANPIERLCYQGKRSMGALEFVPAQDSNLEHGTQLEIDSLVNVAREVLNTKKALDTDISKNAVAGIRYVVVV